MSEWISVKDRMPSYGKTIVCFGSNGGIFLYNGITNMINGKATTFSRWPRTFTHWMPLPEPPKEERKND